MILPSITKKIGRAGVIGRFKPLHDGAKSLLESACENAEHVIIGIGSVNKYDARNPFTKEETKEMIDALLSKKHQNYSIVFIEDYGHIKEYSDGQRWKKEVAAAFGNLDFFITGNQYVKNLLKDTYNILEPEDIIPQEKQIMMRASLVRIKMAKREDWESLLPKEVSSYLKKNRLDERFRKEFGEETISMMTNGKKYRLRESAEEERASIINIIQ